MVFGSTWPMFVLSMILFFVFSIQSGIMVQMYRQYLTLTSSTDSIAEKISPSQITHCAWIEHIPLLRDLKTSAEMLEAFHRQNSTASLIRFSGYAVPGFVDMPLADIQAKYFKAVITFFKRGFICQTVIAKPELVFIFEKLIFGASDTRMFAFDFSHPLYKTVDVFDIFVNSPTDSLWGASFGHLENHNWRKNSTTGFGDKQHLKLAMKSLTIERLESPYSNCVNYEPQFRSRKHCFNECVLKRGIEELGIIPLSAM